MTTDGRKAILIALCLIAAGICIIYGILVRAVGSGTGFFVVWLGLGLIFFLLAVAVRMDIWMRLPGMLQKLCLLLVAVGMVSFLIVECCVVKGFHEKGEPGLDYLIVLGAQVYEHGPSVVLKYRLDKAVEYLEKNPGTVCIVTGGQGYNEPFPEAVGEAAYLKEHGISEDRIILETASTTTEQNISNSMGFMEEHASVGIVTNNFHVFRAVQTAKKQGLEQVCGIAAGATPLYLPNNMLREFFGMIKFLL